MLVVTLQMHHFKVMLVYSPYSATPLHAERIVKFTFPRAYHVVSRASVIFRIAGDQFSEVAQYGWSTNLSYIHEKYNLVIS